MKMISPVLYFTVFSIVTSNFQVSADVDLETLSQIVRNHSNILNEFPSYLERINSVEKRIQDYEPKLSEYEAHTKTLQQSIVELKNVSEVFTNKLLQFQSYTTRTDKLESQIIPLLETAETHGGTLSGLEIYNRRTNVLEEYVNKIKDDLKISAYERYKISESLESSHKALNDQKAIITSELAKISTVSEKQQDVVKKLNVVDEAIKDIENATSQNINMMQENYSTEQSKLKSKVTDVENIAQVEDDLARKLTSIITQFEEQSRNTTSKLQSLQNNFSDVQSEINIQFQKINPFVKKQEEITNKMNNFVSSLDEAKQTQQTLEKSFKDLSDQIQQFIGSHSCHY